jgi:hypothetical protein
MRTLHLESNSHTDSSVQSVSTSPTYLDTMPPKKVILRVPPQPTMPQLPTDSKKSTSRIRARRVEQSAISPETALSRAVTLQNEIINARIVPSSQSSEISPSATRFLGMLPEDDFMDDYPMTSAPVRP